MPTVKIVIINWNGRQMMERFLPSVVAATPREFGIVVADNGSTDDSLEWIEATYGNRVEVVALERNWGFAGGYNRALAQIEADYYILLNSDVECAQGWCEPLIDYLERNPSTAVVQPKILSLSDRDRFEYAGASGGYIDRYGYPFCRGRILSFTERDNGQYDDVCPIFWASGAAFAVRADAFARAGGFDDDFFAHCEEIDLCWRLQSLGYRIAVVPASVVYHLGGGTLQTGSPQKIYYNFRNSLLMLHKNLPADQEYIIGRRMALDRLSAVVYRLTGHKEWADAVRRAHDDYRAARETTDAKREAIRSATVARVSTIYRGSILLRYALGKRRFGKLKI